MRKKRFIIVSNADTVSAEDEDRLTQFLRSRNWEVWHWFSSLWLVVTDRDIESAESLAKEVRDLASIRQIVVFDAPPNTKGFGIHLPGASTEWLRKKWHNSTDTVNA